MIREKLTRGGAGPVASRGIQISPAGSKAHQNVRLIATRSNLPCRQSNLTLGAPKGQSATLPAATCRQPPRESLKYLVYGPCVAALAAPGFHRADTQRQAVSGPHVILGPTQSAAVCHSCQTLELTTHANAHTRTCDLCLRGGYDATGNTRLHGQSVHVRGGTR